MIFELKPILRRQSALRSLKSRYFEGQTREKEGSECELRSYCFCIGVSKIFDTEVVIFAVGWINFLTFGIGSESTRYLPLAGALLNCLTARLNTYTHEASSFREVIICAGRSFSRIDNWGECHHEGTGDGRQDHATLSPKHTRLGCSYTSIATHTTTYVTMVSLFISMPEPGHVLWIFSSNVAPRSSCQTRPL